MALSGSVGGSVVDGHYSAWVDWEASQDIGSNTSTITATLYFSCDWDIYIGSRTHTVWIDGEAFDIEDGATSGTGTWAIGSVSKTIEHESDGTRAFSISFSYDLRATLSGDYYGSITGGDSWSLDTIPRTSSISLSSSSIDFGNNITISINRASDSFVHNIYYAVNGAGETAIAYGATTSCTWQVPYDLMNKIPNATSMNITITVNTYNSDDVYIGTTTATFTATVPTRVVPSISAITCTDPYGYVSKFGGYVQSKSKVKITASTAGVYSSTIKSYKITANGQNYTSNGCTTDVLATAGTNTITVTVTDSRGRTATKTTTISVLAYSSPIIAILTAYRCTSDGTADEEGAYMKVTFNASVTALNNKNTKSFTLKYKKQSVTSYTTHTTYTNAYIWNSSVIIAADINSAYDIQLNAVDYYGTTTMIVQVSTAFTLMDFRKTGRGVAIGKVSEKDAFECNMDADFKKNVFINGNDSMANFVNQAWVENNTSTWVPVFNNNKIEHTTKNDIVLSGEVESIDEFNGNLRLRTYGRMVFCHLTGVTYADFISYTLSGKWKPPYWMAFPVVGANGEIMVTGYFDVNVDGKMNSWYFNNFGSQAVWASDWRLYGVGCWVTSSKY